LSELLQYEDLLAVPWRKGGRSPEGLDCYGLVKTIYFRLGRELPEIEETPEAEAVDAIDRLWQEGHVNIGERRDAPEPYCVVIFAIRPPWVSHMGVVLPEGRFIHILRGRTVQVDRLNHPYWKGKIAGYYRWKR